MMTTDEELAFCDAIENAQRNGMLWEFVSWFFKEYEDTNKSVGECIFHANREWDL